jgi:hypothetical protein
MFSRTMGGVIGVALMGAMLNSRMSHYFNGTSGSGSSSTGELVNDLLDPVKRGGYQPEVLHAVQHDLAGALHSTYLIPIIAAIVALVLVVFAFPGGKVEKHSVNQSR